MGEEENEEPTSPLPPPLCPKSKEEWGYLLLDAASIGMIYVGFTGSCPAIPSAIPFICTFFAVNILIGMLNFIFSLRRKGMAQHRPNLSKTVQFLGLAQLGIGIWGIAIMFPNFGYFGNPSSETCEIGPLIAITIPSVIIALAIVGLIGYSAYSLVVKKKKDEEQPQAKVDVERQV